MASYLGAMPLLHRFFRQPRFELVGTIVFQPTVPWVIFNVGYEAFGDQQLRVLIYEHSGWSFQLRWS